MDDTEINRKAATVLLAGHNVTVVASVAQAKVALKRMSFDVLLTDLLVPVSQAGSEVHSGGEEFPHNWEGMEGQEIPLGLFLAVRALIGGVRLVAVVTDADHHQHPAARALDLILGANRLGDGTLLCVSDAKAWLKEDTLEPIPGKGGGYSTANESYEQILDDKGRNIVGFKGLVKSKAWHTALKRLLETPEGT